MASLLRTCDVEFIMLDRELQAALYRHLRGRVPADLLPMLIQYPGRWRGAAIRHRNHHRNHLHVRFRRGNRPLEHPGTSYLCGGPAGRRLMQRIPTEL
jgi:hypothetical protein